MCESACVHDTVLLMVSGSPVEHPVSHNQHHIAVLKAEHCQGYLLGFSYLGLVVMHGASVFRECPESEVSAASVITTRGSLINNIQTRLRGRAHQDHLYLFRSAGSSS